VEGQKAIALMPGGRAPLFAIAYDPAGAPIAAQSFEWTSSSTAVATASGAAVLARAAGSATFSAVLLADRVACSGGVAVAVFDPPPAGLVRVRVVADEDETPLAGASVSVLVAAGLTSGSSDQAGIFLGGPGAPLAVTAAYPGRATVSVLEPGTDSLRIGLPAAPPDRPTAGGFRGSVDFGQLPRRDVDLGFVGTALPFDPLGWLASLRVPFCGAVPGVLDAPELGWNARPVHWPEGFVFTLGSKHFTDDSEAARERCPGPPSAGEVGCFLATAPAGPTALWTLGDALTLSDFATDTLVPPPVSALGDDVFNSCTAWPEWLPHLRRGRAGLRLADPAPQLPAGAGPSYGMYLGQDAALTAGEGLRAVVRVPPLPGRPNGQPLGAVLLATGAILPGRGLAPLGFGSGTLDPNSGLVAGDASPFGPLSTALPEGQLALTAAPPGPGAEASERFLLALVMQPGGMKSGTPPELAGAFSRFAELSRSATVPPFLALPEGTLDLAARRLRHRSPLAGGSFARLTVERPGAAWIVYSPDPASLDLSALDLAGIFTSDTALMVAEPAPATTYSDLWALGRLQPIERLPSRFAIEACGPKLNGLGCVIQ
jgi:hypothetical protein